MSHERQKAIMDRLDCALGYSYDHDCDDDFYDVVERSLDRIETAIARSSKDPGRWSSLVERVEMVAKDGAA